MTALMLAVVLVAAGIQAAPAWAASDGGRAAGVGHQPSGLSEPESAPVRAQLII
jgi:hypothetical protein